MLYTHPKDELYTILAWAIVYYLT